MTKVRYAIIVFSKLNKRVSFLEKAKTEEAYTLDSLEDALHYKAYYEMYYPDINYIVVDFTHENELPEILNRYKLLKEITA